jgi:hypothetical protein
VTAPLGRCRYFKECGLPAAKVIVWHRHGWRQRLWWTRPQQFRVCAAHEMRPLDDRKAGTL